MSARTMDLGQERWIAQLPYVSTAIGIHIHLNSRHFGSLAACFLVSADRAATPANLLDSFRETGVRGEVTVMSRAAGWPLSQPSTRTSAGRE